MTKRTGTILRTGETRRHLMAAGRRGRRAVRALAQGTLIAAGIAVTQLGLPDTDSRFHLFNPGLVDRLQAPITRYRD